VAIFTSATAFAHASCDFVDVRASSIRIRRDVAPRALLSCSQHHKHPFEMKKRSLRGAVGQDSSVKKTGASIEAPVPCGCRCRIKPDFGLIRSHRQGLAPPVTPLQPLVLLPPIVAISKLEPDFR
jgi:hypothetical protein